MPETPAPPADPAASPPALAPAAPPRAAAADPFSAEEYSQFAKEDGRAGKFIGWLLCTLFVYTILVASAAIWWTMQSV